MKRLIKNGTWGAVCLYAACATAVAPPPGSASTEGIDGHFTKPSKDLTLTFIGRGRIAKVLVKEGDKVNPVKEGDKVNPGDVLVQQDNAAEQLQLAQLKALADDEIHIKAADETLKQKIVDFEELKEAGVGFAVSPFEFNRAKLDVTIAELSKDKQIFEREQNRLKYKGMQIQVDRMRLLSPIAGKVEEIFVGEGESVDAGQKVVRVVKIDPLWIDLQVDMDKTRRLKVGGAARVEFPEADTPPVIGTITFIAAVAVARDRIVRVEIPNKRLDPAGEPVIVYFLKQDPRAKVTKAPLAKPKTAQPAKASRPRLGKSSSEKPLSNVTGKAVSNKPEKE